MANEREDVADELRRVRDRVRGEVRASLPPEAEEAGVPEPGAGSPPASDPRPALEGHRGRTGEAPEPEAAPRAPDTTGVNAGWNAEPLAPARGPLGFLRRGLERLLGGRFQAQREWNARQVRLDNELVAWVEARFAATHRHYDCLLGREGQRLDEVDTRHALLERELAAHVRDLARRIDLVLAESVRERAALEFALEEARARLARLEDTLARTARTARDTARDPERSS